MFDDAKRHRRHATVFVNLHTGFVCPSGKLDINRSQ